MRVLTAFALASATAFAQESALLDAAARIRQEAMERSRVMQHLHVLADRYGPRLTGSPNYEAAARWAAS